ncbi:MAG: glycerate kinase [Spirochaetota bacterium]|nr:glycerate kinase [Spirochaetota bacterium]
MSKVRDDIKGIYTKAIEAANPAQAIKKQMRIENRKLILYSGEDPYKYFPLEKYKRILVVGAGKATASMARAIEEIFGDNIDVGCIIVKYGYTEGLKRIEIIEASHPLPDDHGLAGARRIRGLLMDAGEDDLVISLISGGGSALLPLPPDTILLEEKGETTNLLLRSGASIHEINSVRKHISLVKGGNLAKAAYPARVINLMISDVVGDDMDVIASGPFVPDNSSFNDAMSILKKYDIDQRVPGSVLDYIKSGIEGNVEENPGEDSAVFQRVTNHIIASNIIALRAAREESEGRGYNTIILSSFFEGETKDVAFFHYAIAKEIIESSNPISKPACVISGGETTVTVSGSGIGGRNMEFAMHGAVYINGSNNITLASVGTDGTDGPTDAAGAIVDGNTMRIAAQNGIDIYGYIENNDSYNLFKEVGGLVITGPTNTNVMDIRIMLLV